MTIPWLLPFTYGPTGAATGWLVCAIVAAVIWLGSSYPNPKTLANSWYFAALISAVMGLLQFFGYGQNLSPWVTTAEIGEAFANLRQRNQFATLLNIGLIALLWKAKQRHAVSQNAEKELFSALTSSMPIVLLAFANAASASRTGMVQWTMVGASTILWRQRGDSTPTLLGVWALATYFIAVFLLPGFLEYVSGRAVMSLVERFGEMPGCASRLTLWSNVLHLIAQKPWLGWGWGELDYAHFTSLYPEQRFCEILDNAHNLPLHLAVELGLPVALFFCSVCAWLVWRNKPWAEADPTRQMAWGVLAVIGLHSMLEYPLWYGPFQLAVLLCIWILWTVAPRKLRTPRTGTFSLIAGRLAALTLIGICAIVAWDYWRVSQLYLQPAARSAMYREDTLKKVRNTWFFGDQVKFAHLTTTELTAENAEWIHTLALEMLHFSPEPRVIEKVIESAVMLGLDAEALYYLQRYKAAFPAQHARWSQALNPGE